MTEGTIEVASNIARAADEITATFVTTRNHLMKFTLDFAYIPNFRSPSMWNNQIGFHTKTANNSKVIGYSLANISGSILDVYDKLELTSSITAVHYLGDMYIVGDVELRSDLEVYGNLLGTGGLHIEGFTLYCYCTNNNQYSEGIDCDLYIENGVFNGYECHLNSNIYIKGGDCTVTGDVTIYGDIYVHDGTFLSYGMLTVNGNIYAEHGLFQINGVLFLSGRLVQGDGDVKVNFIVPI